VVAAVTDKMVRRHPHVFGDMAGIDTAEAQVNAWENHKARERAEKPEASLLDDVPRALPALTRALKLQKRAASIGFDWDSAPRVVEKLAEEAGEIVAAKESGAGHAEIEEEVGDLLFVIANLARHLKVQPEDALRAANEKFSRRFHFIEQSLREQGKSPHDATLEEMESLWQRAKASERHSST
jgi:ATP diphosphatase